jgi:hypothetical protein
LDIVRHLDLAGQNLLGCLCPERNYLPYWHIVVDDQRRADYQFRPHCNGHNVGRWWNAMLRLQACTGFHIPPTIEAAMLDHTWRMCCNPTGILLDDPQLENVHTWYLHSYRETMLSLALLVKYRDSEPARRHGLHAIEQMRKASHDLSQWDLSLCDQGPKGLEYKGRRGEPAYTHGRAIEGLLCFYEATGETAALAEAERVADFHFDHSLESDGRLGAGCGHHTHSYLNAVRGLILLALLKGQSDRLQTILATYQNAISRMITRSGFITHDIGARLDGDIASTGDVAHIALLLFGHFKDPRLLEDAERLVRCRLIPSQVCAPMPIHPMGTGQRDGSTNLPERFVGAIGGSVGHVRGQTCVTDFTAAALHSLIEIYLRTVEVDETCVRINFHFDCNRSGVRVASLRNGSSAHLTIRNDTGKKTHIRIPSWAPRPSLELAVNDNRTDLEIDDNYAVIPGTAVATKIELRYDLPEHAAEEPWCAADATQELATFKWRGDEIREVDPVGRYLEPFPLENGSFLVQK